MSNEVQPLREMLLKGIKLSMQSSLARRKPAPAATPFLEQARTGLKALTTQDGRNAVAWRLLSQAEECLLNYSAAVKCLETAIELTGYTGNKERKRLALLKESLSERARFPLSPDELASLGQFLKDWGATNEVNGRTLERTTRWLEDNDFDVPDVIDALARRGAFTDFQVLYNLVRG
jgi:hypothetical protein